MYLPISFVRGGEQHFWQKELELRNLPSQPLMPDYVIIELTSQARPKCAYSCTITSQKNI